MNDIRILLIIITGIIISLTMSYIIDINSMPTDKQITKVCIKHNGLQQIHDTGFSAEQFVICKDGYGDYVK